MFVYLCSRPAHRHSLMAGFMADAHINIDYPSANCGRHARVWNRTFALRVLTQRRMACPWIAIPVNQKKAYFSLCIIKYFLDIISPNNDMKDKIDTLLSAYSSIDTSAMGFPRGWESEPLWQ